MSFILLFFCTLPLWFFCSLLLLRTSCSNLIWPSISYAKLLLAFFQPDTHTRTYAIWIHSANKAKSKKGTSQNKHMQHKWFQNVFIFDERIQLIRRLQCCWWHSCIKQWVTAANGSSVLHNVQKWKCPCHLPLQLYYTVCPKWFTHPLQRSPKSIAQMKSQHWNKEPKCRQQTKYVCTGFVKMNRTKKNRLFSCIIRGF